MDPARLNCRLCPACGIRRFYLLRDPDILPWTSHQFGEPGRWRLARETTFLIAVATQKESQGNSVGSGPARAEMGVICSGEHIAGLRQDLNLESGAQDGRNCGGEAARYPNLASGWKLMTLLGTLVLRLITTQPHIVGLNTFVSGGRHLYPPGPRSGCLRGAHAQHGPDGVR